MASINDLSSDERLLVLDALKCAVEACSARAKRSGSKAAEAAYNADGDRYAAVLAKLKLTK